MIPITDIADALAQLAGYPNKEAMREEARRVREWNDRVWELAEQFRKQREGE